MPFIAAGGAILGGLLGGSSARRAAQTQADAQTRAAQLAAEEARFRPVGITTRFGQSQFQTGIPGVNAPVAADFATPEEFQAAQSAYQTRLQREGRVTGASYTLDPQLKALQDQFLGLAGGGLDQAAQAQQQFAPLGQAAQGLFGLGQQYLSQPADPRLGELAGQFLGPSAGAQALTSLGQQYVAQSPQEAAQQFMSQQQNLLAPSRERQFAQLQNQLFQTGRGGLSVGATGERPSGAAGLGAASPEMEAYYNALAQQDAGLAAQAQQAGQQQTAFGAGLLGQGQALGQGQIGFGADLLGRQQAMEQGRTSFGAGLFGTGGNLLTQGYGGQAAALDPYQAYMRGATGLESLGQAPLDIGAQLGGRMANPTGAQALFQGGMGAAQSMGAANAYNPFATALTGLSQNPQFTNAIARQFSGGSAQPSAGNLAGSSFAYDTSGRAVPII
jgi:hypothetical protein